MGTREVAEAPKQVNGCVGKRIIQTLAIVGSNPTNDTLSGIIEGDVVSRDIRLLDRYEIKSQIYEVLGIKPKEIVLKPITGGQMIRLKREELARERYIGPGH